jgi:hypothetical protein
MTSNVRYPFELNDVFFIDMHFTRKSALPEPLVLQFEVQFKIVYDDLPKRLQTHLKIYTLDEGSPLSINAELIGLFNYTADPRHLDQARAAGRSFIRDGGLATLWPYLTQTIKAITIQMGLTKPISFSRLPDVVWPDETGGDRDPAPRQAARRRRTRAGRT